MNRMKNSGRTFLFRVGALLFLFLFLAGCTERERGGFSSIPQNSPASWELAPYGDLRN